MRRHPSSFLAALQQDLRFAIRMFAQRPGSSAAIVLTIALGIGANTALFSVVRAVLLRPLAYVNPDRLVVISRGATPIRYDEMRSAAHSYAALGAFAGPTEQMALTSNRAPEVVTAARVSANFLDILGLSPAAGRTFRSAEERPGAPDVAMISAGLWQRRFAADPSVVGRTLTLAGSPFIIIGILPPRFEFPYPAVDVWMTKPAELALLSAQSRPLSPFLQIFGRLRSDVDTRQATSELLVLARQYAAAHPGMLDGKTYDPSDGTPPLQSLRQSFVTNVRLPLLLLMGAVGLLQLIVCANVAGLSLARAATRSREFALRVAMGASRMRLVRQLLTESILVAAFGGALGVLCAQFVLRALRNTTSFDLPRQAEIHLDPAILCFALALSLLTGILFGLAPALSAFTPHLTDALRGNQATPAPHRLRRWLAIEPRSVLVAGQIGLSIILLVGSALLLQSLANLYRVDPGFRPQQVLTMSVSLPSSYDTQQKRADFYRQLADRVAALPGVEHAGVTLTLPTTGWAGSPVALTTRPSLPLNQRPIAIVQQVSPDYFQTLQIAMRRGRAFSDADNTTAPPVVIISEALARRFWPDYPAGPSPLGTQLLVGASKQPLQIVGIAADVRETGRDAPPMPGVYLAVAQQSSQSAILVLRTRNDPALFAETVRHQVLAIDHNQPVSHVRTLSAVLDESELQRRLILSLLGGFAVAALLLALLGLYSVVSYSVVERTQEIAIRLALGAPRYNILGLVVRQGIALALAGIVVGVLGALELTQLLKSMLFGVAATDIATLLLVSATFLLVAFAACYLPASRAVAMQPLDALRSV